MTYYSFKKTINITIDLEQYAWVKARQKRRPRFNLSACFREKLGDCIEHIESQADNQAPPSYDCINERNRRPYLTCGIPSFMIKITRKWLLGVGLIIILLAVANVSNAQSTETDSLSELSEGYLEVNARELEFSVEDGNITISSLSARDFDEDQLRFQLVKTTDGLNVSTQYSADSDTWILASWVELRSLIEYEDLSGDGYFNSTDDLVVNSIDYVTLSWTSVETSLEVDGQLAITLTSAESLEMRIIANQYLISSTPNQIQLEIHIENYIFHSDSSQLALHILVGDQDVDLVVETSENSDLGYTSGEQAIMITEAVGEKSVYLAWDDTFSNGSDTVQVTNPKIVTNEEAANLYFELGRNAEIKWTLAAGVNGIFVDAPSTDGGLLDSIDLVSVGIGLAIGLVGGGALVKTIWPASWSDTKGDFKRKETEDGEVDVGDGLDKQEATKTGRNPQTGKEVQIAAKDGKKGGKERTGYNAVNVKTD